MARNLPTHKDLIEQGYKSHSYISQEEISKIISKLEEKHPGRVIHIALNTEDKNPDTRNLYTKILEIEENSHTS